MIKAIIVDDEVHCVDTLSILLADFCPEVQIMEKCMSAKKGLEAALITHRHYNKTQQRNNFESVATR